MKRYITFKVNAAAGSGGFTLVELLVVMTIIAALAMIAVPMFLGQRTKAMRSEALTNLESIRMLQEQNYAEYGEYADSAGTCAQDNPNNIGDIQGELPDFKPGSGDNLFYSYCIEKNKAVNPSDLMGALVANTPCFAARAFGNSNYVNVDGTELRVDCNNVKSY